MEIGLGSQASTIHQPTSRTRAWTSTVGSDWLLPLIVGILVRLCFIWANEMDEGDWVARTIRAKEFIAGRAPIWGRTPWPEGNYLLPSIPLALGGDAYWSVRIFSALFAAIAIPLIYYTGREIGDRDGGRIAAWVMALLPFHIYISGNGAMTEGPFLVFVLASLATAIRWVREPNEVRWLIYCALCVIGAESFRFDGVFVGASIGMIALFIRNEHGFVIRQPRLLAAIVLFGLLSLAYPIALLISWKVFYGDAMHMVKFAEENTTQFFAGGGHQRWPRWFYILYCIAFWPVVGPLFALTPLFWLLSWVGIWRVRKRVTTWIVVAPVVVLTLFYMKAALAYTLLNQIRYVTALSLPLLAFVWIPLRNVSPRRQKMVLITAFALLGVAQIVPIDAAWHDRGVVSRQLATYALVRPDQYDARDALRWINQHATPGDKVVFTPHAGSAWLTLASYSTPIQVRRLNIYRTTNLVYDSVGMVTVIRDSLRSAKWLVASGRKNTEGLKDALVTELVRPDSVPGSAVMAWNGTPLKLATTIGSLTVYAVQASGDSSSTRNTP